MIREAIRLTRSFQWTQHLPPLLHLLAQGQIAANDRMGVMATLAELQKLLRTGQLEPDRRLRAGIAVALCQQALGQGELARGTLANAVTSGQRDGLSAWMLREAADFSLNEVPAPGAQRSEAAGGPNAARGENFADLQPIQVQSSVLPHEKARARFTLSNPTAAIVKGHLRFEAEGMGTNWDADHGLANVTLGPTVGAREDRHSLTLLPGEEFLIVAETVGAGRDRKLELFWTPEIGAGQHCLWRVGQTPDDGMEIAVTNASLALRNPFYAIRLHHALVRRGGSDAQPVNLRVRSSHPVRVEMLDPATDRLLAVDAQADADFHAGGDFVHTDADADGAPDLTAPTGEPVEVALLVYPLDRTKAPGEITLTLQIKDPDGWHDAAQDTLK